MSEIYLGGKPYAHQERIVRETWDKPYWGLFCEMGVGKSYMLIMTMVNLYLAGKVDTFLYVAKKGEYANFQVYELERWWPKHIKRLQYIYTGYSSTQQVKNIKAVLPSRVEPRIMSMNIEAIRSERPYALAEKFVRSSSKTMIIVDESTTMKDPKSTQTKALLQLRKYCRYARISTGTVAANSPVDVWSQVRFLDNNVLGYRSITAFKSEYLVQEDTFAGNRRYKSTVGFKNLRELNNRLKRTADIVLKKDCLDLPEKVYKRHLVKLTLEQIRLYKEFVDFSVTQLGGGDYVEAVNALAVNIKLHQIVCGQLRDTEGVYHDIDNNRFEECYNIIDGLMEAGERKIIVWSHFVRSTARLREYLSARKLGVVHMVAGLSTDERSQNIHEFKTNPNMHIYLANQQSSGFGSTLTESCSAIYFSNSDNYELRLQSEDRIHRIGQEQKCLYVDMHTPGTVEDNILNRANRKGDMRQGLMSRDDFIDSISFKGGYGLPLGV